MRPTLPSFLLVLCLAQTALAQNEISTLLAAVSGGDSKAGENAVSIGLKSADARVRAIAARVANVRRMTNLVPAIVAYSDRETNVEAAREMMRAMIMLGGLRHVDRGFYISDRFSKRLDADVANAAAHLGAPAVDAYFASMLQRNVDRFDFFRIALWGQPQAVPGVAARLLKTDTDGFENFLFMNGYEPRLLIDTDTLQAALTHSNYEVRATTVWFLVNQALRQRGAFEARLKEIIAGLRVPRDHADLIVSVELLRRAVGLPKRDFIEFRQSLANGIVRIRVYLASENVLSLLTDTERRILTGSPDEDEEEHMSANLPAFVLPSPLPAGLASGTLALTGCREGWFGTAKIRVDELGYVVTRDLAGVNTSEACRRALDMLLQLSIAENHTISAPRQSDTVSLVRGANASLCFDEAPVPTIRTKYVYGSPSMRMPRVKRRVAPVWPGGVPRKPTEVVVEVMVTSQGCARSVRVVDPSPIAAINAAALSAAQQWQFQPGSVNTYPIDMLYDVSVEFTP